LELLGVQELVLPFDDERKIFGALRSVDLAKDEPLTVFIDYSSMSRMWYNSIIKFFHHSNHSGPVTVDLAYTVGKYSDVASYRNQSESDLSVQEILCVPGLEGTAMRLQRSIALVGLGFEKLPPFGVAEVLEADTLVGFIADAGAFPEYASVAEEINAEFLREYTRDVALMRLPLRSVETAYRALADFIAPHRQSANVILVPLGPKPHVLACLLLARRFAEVTCLYAKVLRRRAPIVEPASSLDIVGTRVEINV